MTMVHVIMEVAQVVVMDLVQDTEVVMEVDHGRQNHKTTLYICNNFFPDSILDYLILLFCNEIIFSKSTIC
jgi:hypothetical protein